MTCSSIKKKKKTQTIKQQAPKSHSHLAYQIMLR